MLALILESGNKKPHETHQQKFGSQFESLKKQQEKTRVESSKAEQRGKTSSKKRQKTERRAKNTHKIPKRFYEWAKA